mgnify:CR=1 FL=1
MSDTVTTTVRTEFQTLKKRRSDAAKSIKRDGVKTHSVIAAFTDIERQVADLETFLKD